VHHVITDKAYADGLKTSIDNKGNKALRNAPTLINAVFQKSFFLDGRSQTLTEQISEVSSIRTSLMEIHQFSDKILTDTHIPNVYRCIWSCSKKTRKSLELFHPIFDLERNEFEI
jgi:cytochrome c peroxidase